jgi:hypothetical protein
MKLHLITYPGSGEEFLAYHIQQRLERPHVPLKFSVSNEIPNDADYLVTVVRNPGESIGTRLAVETDLSIESALQEYNDLYTYLLSNANMVIKHEDLDKIDDIIVSLFNELNLDTENYKNKTNRILSEDILLQPEHPMESRADAWTRRFQDLTGVDFEANLNDVTVLYDQLLSKSIGL